MATKGPSNRYGNSRGGKQGHKTSHIGFPWAKDFNNKTKTIHFNKHGFQMNTGTEDSYVAHAIKFANTIDRINCISFLDKKDSTYKYNKKTNEFAVISKKGYVITYFKPTEGYEYYLSQKKAKGKK